MANELLVSSTEEGLRIGILENKRIVELHLEKPDNQFTVGDIYLARVKKIMPGLNAAFVDVGYAKDAFLHYLDLGPQFRTLQKHLNQVHKQGTTADAVENLELNPEINKHGKITEVLKTNQHVLVQIVKEAISSKGPRLSCELSLAGQYIILVPYSQDISISRKFKSLEEKKRLKRLLEAIRPPNFGMIVRTAAEGKDIAELEADLLQLQEKWKRMLAAVQQVQPPTRVLTEMDRTTSLLRDMLSVGFDSIITDNQDTFQELTDYLKIHQPDKVKILRLHKLKVPLFEHLGIERQIKASFGKTVNLPSGCYLVIEHTEALHVIDVNSGSTRMNEDSPEANSLRINIEAASEIARQLRLRDMGGIIVIDFIDLRKLENRKAVYDHLNSEMRRDRAKHTVLPMSKFGLIQITRQRVRPEINITTTEVCPSCNGTGKIMPSILLTDEIANHVDYLFKENKESQLEIVVNPYIAAYLKQGFPSIRLKWWMKYKKWVTLTTDSSAPFTLIKYFNKESEEIKFS
ncbi:MAG: Rne/Rng family ribonuclease [Sphingobacteriia bacterium]|nr:Rne/Rng family ribonuclease [Sphingobacteriia bacterium]